MRRSEVLAGVGSTLLVMAQAASGQSPVKVEFDVATVKPAAPLTGRGTPAVGQELRIRNGSIIAL